MKHNERGPITCFNIIQAALWLNQPYRPVPPRKQATKFYDYHETYLHVLLICNIYYV